MNDLSGRPTKTAQKGVWTRQSRRDHRVHHTRETQERSWFSLALGCNRRGGLTLADADAASNAYRNESRNQSKQYFLQWSSPFFHARDSHFVPRCTVSRPLNPMVHGLRRQCGTSKGTVSLGTQLSGVRSKICPPLRGDGGPVCNGFAENPFDSTRKTDTNAVARPL